MPSSAGVKLLPIGNDRIKVVLDAKRAKLQALLPKNLELAISPASQITLEAYERTVAGIHPDAATFFWVYPYMAEYISRTALMAKGYDKDELAEGDVYDDTLIHLLQRGGFVYSDKSGEPVRVNVVA